MQWVHTRLIASSTWLSTMTLEPTEPLSMVSPASAHGKRETTLSKSKTKMSKKETLARRFYQVSGAPSLAEFARLTNFHPVTVRAYMLPEDRKSYRPVSLSALHSWAKELKRSGGPGITIGLWPDGDITLQVEEKAGV